MALEALLERCLPRLTRWAHGRLPAHARGTWIREIWVQEAALHVLARLDKFEPRHVGAMQAYLRMSVINGFATRSGEWAAPGPCELTASRPSGDLAARGR
jgi:DNA-directed RNA polymerase specialized sigma24 family protein